VNGGNYSLLIEELKKLSYLEKKLKVEEGFFVLLIFLTSYFLLATFLDVFFDLPYVLLLSLFIIGIVAISVALVLLPLFKKISYSKIALFIEKRVPDCRNKIINALQLGGQEDSSPLVALIVKDTQKFIASLDYRKVFSRRRLLLSFRIAIGLLAIFVFCYLLFPQVLQHTWMKFFQPLKVGTLSVVSPPILRIKPGNCAVVEGESLPIYAYVKGDKVPSGLKLFYERGGSQDSVFMKFAKDHFTYLFPEIYHPFSYQVKSNQTSSPWYRVEVEEGIKIKSFLFRYQYPSYTGLKVEEKESNEGTIEAPQGSKVEFQLFCNKELEYASLTPPSSKREGETLAKQTTHLLTLISPKQIGGKLRIKDTAEYGLKLVDKKGRSSDFSYSVISILDKVPQINIIAPGKDLQIVEGKESSLDLHLEGKDDYGIEEMQLCYKINSGSEQIAQRWILEKPVREKVMGEQWDLQKLSLKAGDGLTYWVKIKDNDGIGGNKWASSPNFKIELVSEKEDRARVLEEQAKSIHTLAEIVKYQKEIRDKVVDLARASGQAKDLRKIAGKQIWVREESLKFAQQEELFQPFRIRERVKEIANGLMVEALKTMRKRNLEGCVEVENALVKALEILLKESEITREAGEGDKYSLDDLEKLTEIWQEIYEDLDAFIMEEEEANADTELKEEVSGETQPSDLKESQWAKLFADRRKELDRLPDIEFPEAQLMEQFNQIFSDVQKAPESVIPDKVIEMNVSEEEVVLDLAEKLREDLEMWLPDIPDRLRWDLEQPSEDIEVPMADLPSELEDLIGELLESEEELMDYAEDVTSSYADSLGEAGWAVMDGPISNFSAKGKTGNVLPNMNEITGRSGEGRSGPTSGELVQDKAQGLGGRTPPTRYTPDPLMKGQVEELQASPAGGGTGGGKTSGSGKGGLPGKGPYNYLKELKRLEQEAGEILLKTKSVTSQLKSLGYPVKSLEASAKVMHESLQALKGKNLGQFKKKQQEIITVLKDARAVINKEVQFRQELTFSMPKEISNDYIKMRREKLHPAYENLLKSYFEVLSHPE